MLGENRIEPLHLKISGYSIQRSSDLESDCASVNFLSKTRTQPSKHMLKRPEKHLSDVHGWRESARAQT